MNEWYKLTIHLINVGNVTTTRNNTDKDGPCINETLFSSR